MARVLIVGGAGYVGSSTCAWLRDRGHDVWVLDNLSTGRQQLLLPDIAGFTRADVGNQVVVSSVLDEFQPECVMHFAARSLVGESVQKPKEYYENNVVQTEQLLEVMMKKNVKNFVFSSTCAIFGDPGSVAMNEDCPQVPINPYGQTKLQAEQVMQRFSSDFGLRCIALRYFNASGADPKLRVGEWHEPETHLIPRILASIQAGNVIEVYGDDYPTPDGTCIRDYIHVFDLASAHESAMTRLMKMDPASGIFEAFNLGSGNGFSVQEIIQTCEQLTKKTAKKMIQGRRPGDPPRLVADSRLAQKELNFRVCHDLREIISTAWNWELKKGTLV